MFGMTMPQYLYSFRRKFPDKPTLWISLKRQYLKHKIDISIPVRFRSVSISSKSFIKIVHAVLEKSRPQNWVKKKNNQDKKKQSKVFTFAYTLIMVWNIQQNNKQTKYRHLYFKNHYYSTIPCFTCYIAEVNRKDHIYWSVDLKKFDTNDTGYHFSLYFW